MKKLFLLLLPLICLSCDLKKIEEMESTPGFERHFVFDSNKLVDVESVVEASDGGYVISGDASDQSFSFYNMILVKVSAEGTVQKKVTDFGTFNTVSGGKMIKVSDGYIVIGSEYTGSDNQIVVVKFKNDLTRAWTKSFGKPNNFEVIGGLELTTGGDIIVAGSSSPENSTESDPFFLKVRSSDGVMLDSQTVAVPNIGRYAPQAIVRNGSRFGIIGYRQDVSLPITFSMVIDENLNGLVPYNGSTTLGNGRGAIAKGQGDGFVHINGILAQASRQAFIETLDGNGEVITNFEQFSEIPETELLGGCSTAQGQIVGCGWGAQVLGADQFGIATLVSSDISTVETYQFNESGKTVDLSAASPTADGGFILAGTYNDRKEILLVKLNNQFKVQ